MRESKCSGIGFLSLGSIGASIPSVSLTGGVVARDGLALADEHEVVRNAMHSKPAEAIQTRRILVFHTCFTLLIVPRAHRHSRELQNN